MNCPTESFSSLVVIIEFSSGTSPCCNILHSNAPVNGYTRCRECYGRDNNMMHIFHRRNQSGSTFDAGTPTTFISLVRLIAGNLMLKVDCCADFQFRQEL